MRDEYLVFGQPAFDEETVAEVVDVLRSRWVGTGPRVARFQREFAQSVGAENAVALNSCTAALQLSLTAAGLGPGDEVITTPLTFVATLNAIHHAGATPVLIDVDRTTQNIDPDRLASALTPRTRAVMPVHMAGRPCDLASIGAFAIEHGLVVVEDAAHAIGASYHGRPIGSISDLTCFSFYATKNITTAEGGMVTCAREDWAELIETYGLHGLTKGAWERYSSSSAQHYAAVVAGFKHNMTDLQAAIGLHQLPNLDAWRQRREDIWVAYDEAFADLPLELPAPAEPDTVHARHLYTVLVHPEDTGFDRDELRDRLHARRIGTGIHFLPAHLHPYWAERLGVDVGAFGNAELIGARTMSLPMSPHLSDEDVADVIDAVTAELR